MNERKELILNTIIQEHVRTALPVSSGILVEKYKLGVSPATVRNDMAALEEEEYIIQPHTSAGRVPTEKAYRKILEKIKPKKPGKTDESNLQSIFDNTEEKSYKDTAKLVSEMTGATVFWAPHKHNLFYTGIANLLKQPEFTQLNLIYDISSIIDRFDEILEEEYNNFEAGLNIVIGQENPFSPYCTSMIFKYPHEEHDGIFGLLGPMRMDYAKNIGLIEYLGGKLGK